MAIDDPRIPEIVAELERLRAVPALPFVAEREWEDDDDEPTPPPIIPPPTFGGCLKAALALAFFARLVR